MNQDLMDADKVVIAGWWFAMLDGVLVFGDVNRFNELLLEGAVDAVEDAADRHMRPGRTLQELRAAARRAELMLGTVAQTCQACEGEGSGIGFAEAGPSKCDKCDGTGEPVVVYDAMRGMHPSVVTGAAADAVRAFAAGTRSALLDDRLVERAQRSAGPEGR